ncbi:MAG: hypothetical protein R3234_10635, partial [Thermoanaerobaculia bacterium]|nr:hypothetical protein [Thermoanaerobaculia bacterium]
MGADIIRCYLGFPTHGPSPLATDLEERSARLARDYRRGHYRLNLALDRLHEATDSAVDGNVEASDRHLQGALKTFQRAHEHGTRMHRELVATRRTFQAQAGDPTDPFVRRERWFPRLDRDELAHRLREVGVDPGHSPLTEVLSRVREEGTPGGIRLLEKEVRRIQTEIQRYVSDTGKIPRRPATRFADGLHARAAATLALALPWSRFANLAGTLGFVCQAALERELA